MPNSESDHMLFRYLKDGVFCPKCKYYLNKSLFDIHPESIDYDSVHDEIRCICDKCNSVVVLSLSVSTRIV